MKNTTSVFSLDFNSVGRLEIKYHETESWNNGTGYVTMRILEIGEYMIKSFILVVFYLYALILFI